MRAPRPLRTAGLVAFVAVWIVIDKIATVLSRNEDTNQIDDGFDPDEPERIMEFDAAAGNGIHYQPTEDTLEAASDSTHEYNVHVERRVEIEPDRLEEWVDANYDVEDHVYIRTKHGAIAFSQGEPIGYECPVCGRNTSLIKMTGGEREWIHIDEDRSCTLEVTDGE